MGNYTIATVVVPAPIVDLGFVGLMILGVAIVYKTLRHPPKGGASEISIFKSRLMLKGPAWLVMLLIGALMVAAPIIVAAAEHDSETPFEPSKPAKSVTEAEVKEPDYQSFLFLRDVSQLDLRSALTQPWYTHLPGVQQLRGSHVRVRPATLTNYMVIRKIGDAPQLHIIYSTSGALDLRCLTQPFEVAKTHDKHDQEVGELIIDVRSIPKGAEFTVINEVTYWNAFHGSAGDDYTTYTHNQTEVPEEISAVAIFPEAKPYSTITVTEQPPNVDKTRPVSTLAQESTPTDHKSFYFKTTAPSGQWFYKIAWKW